MEYREWRPHPVLRPYVRVYWTLEASREAVPAQPILPDGSSELVVHRASPFCRHTSDRGMERQSRRLFVGQMRAPVVLQAEGAADVVGIRFRPQGAFALLGGPQHPFGDAIPEVDGLGLRWLSEATRRAEEADTAVAALAHLEAAFLRRIAGGVGAADRRLHAVLDIIDGAGGDVRVEEAAGRAGTTRRHLERLFADQVGLAPKLYARLLRFQAAAARVVAQPAAALAAVSGDAGYFDQSHMIRDFLAFSGSSPEQMRRGLGPMTAWMLRGDGR